MRRLTVAGLSGKRNLPPAKGDEEDASGNHEGTSPRLGGGGVVADVSRDVGKERCPGI
jgi:hypothetical protein